MRIKWPVKVEYEIGFEFSPRSRGKGGWLFKPFAKTSLRKRKKPDRTKTMLKKLGAKKTLEWISTTQGMPTNRTEELILDHIVRNNTTSSVTFVATLVDGHVTWQLRGLADGAPCWSYEKLRPRQWEELLGQFGLFYPELYKKLGHDEFKNMLKYHRQWKEARVLEFTTRPNGRLSIQFAVTMKLAPYDKGRMCNCIPIPGKAPKIKRESDLSVDSPEIVLASPLVEADLERMSQIWQDHSAKSVLVCGPPGSGKENLTMSVPYGSGRNTEGMQALSLAECELDQTLRRLFGFRRDDGSISPGLIEQAKESSLFLDEAHQPEDNPGARAALLRVLEAGTYYPIGSDKAEDVEKVLWLFASSRDLAGPNSIGKLEPPDFWTRMSHVVQVRHPLDPVALEEFRKEKLKELREKLEELRKKSEELREKSEKVRAKVKNLREKSEKLRLKSEKLREKLKELREKSEELREKSEKLQEKLKEHREKTVQEHQLEALARFFCFFWMKSLEEYFDQEIVEIPFPESPPASDDTRPPSPGEIIVYHYCPVISRIMATV